MRSEVLSHTQLCNPRYLNYLASSCVHDLSQCCPSCSLEQTLYRSAGTHSWFVALSPKQYEPQRKARLRDHPTAKKTCSRKKCSGRSICSKEESLIMNTRNNVAMCITTFHQLWGRFTFALTGRVSLNSNEEFCQGCTHGCHIRTCAAHDEEKLFSRHAHHVPHLAQRAPQIPLTTNSIFDRNMVWLVIPSRPRKCASEVDMLTLKS